MARGSTEALQGQGGEGGMDREHGGNPGAGKLLRVTVVVGVCHRAFDETLRVSGPKCE